MVQKIKRNIRLYMKYVSVILRSAMQYKLSFWLMAIGRFFVAFNGFAALFFLFSGFTNIKGYTYGDILLCFSVMQMSFSIAECVGSGFKSFSWMVKRGEFDRMLLRPCSPILQVLGTKFEIGRIGPLITAIITMVIGIRNSQVEWHMGIVLTLVSMIVGGVLLFVGLFMLGASICFFSIEDSSIINVLTYGAKEHGKYPIDIYGKGLMSFCTYVIPYTLIQYYPLQYILGKTQHWQYALYPFGVVVFLAVCYGVWCLGVRNYKSCGS